LSKPARGIHQQGLDFRNTLPSQPGKDSSGTTRAGNAPCQAYRAAGEATQSPALTRRLLQMLDLQKSYSTRPPATPHCGCSSAWTPEAHHMSASSMLKSWPHGFYMGHLTVLFQEI